MTQITIRGMDPEMEQEIRRMARKSGKSLNRVIIDILDRHTGKKKVRKAPAESLKKLAGGWSEKDAVNFHEAIKSCEQIDEELWR